MKYQHGGVLYRIPAPPSLWGPRLRPSVHPWPGGPSIRYRIAHHDCAAGDRRLGRSLRFATADREHRQWKRADDQWQPRSLLAREYSPQRDLCHATESGTAELSRVWQPQGKWKGLAFLKQ